MSTACYALAATVGVADGVIAASVVVSRVEVTIEADSGGTGLCSPEAFAGVGSTGDRALVFLRFLSRPTRQSGKAEA
jgi:hypothetical protein